MSMRTWLAAAAVAAVLAPAARAQRERPGGGAGLTLANPQVVEELKLTDEQKAKLKELVPDIRETFAKLRDVPENERREKMRELREKGQEAAKKAADVLTSQQKKRLQQIEWQATFPMSLREPQVAEAVKLTDEQKEKIKGLAEAQREAMAKLRDGGGRGNLREAMEKLAAGRKDMHEKALAVLTDEQKKAWKELTGEPFELRPGAGRFGGGEGTPQRRRRPNAERAKPAAEKKAE